MSTNAISIGEPKAFDVLADFQLANALATVNRTLALLRTILRRCHREWEWLDRAPAVRLLNEPTLRIRFLTRDQAAALLRGLPQHLRDMAPFALATGFAGRQRNESHLAAGRESCDDGDAQEDGPN